MVLLVPELCNLEGDAGLFVASPDPPPMLEFPSIGVGKTGKPTMGNGICRVMTLGLSLAGSVFSPPGPSVSVSEKRCKGIGRGGRPDGGRRIRDSDCEEISGLVGLELVISVVGTAGGRLGDAVGGDAAGGAEAFGWVTNEGDFGEDMMVDPMLA